MRGASGSAGGAAVRQGVDVTLRNARREERGAGRGLARLPHCPFLFIQIFSNPIKFETVKDGLLLLRKIQIKYLFVWN
jgi:hypothetical protein